LIGPRIALKGGTALNVFHSDLDRLSVDIDVNYIGAIEKGRMDADRPGLEDRIQRLMESKGYAARRGPCGRQMDLPLRLRARRGGHHRD
jgi:Nucleotidyl transferase AbiEii toxin, Type IV TA system